jgi:hypothetical protein
LSQEKIEAKSALSETHPNRAAKTRKPIRAFLRFALSAVPKARLVPKDGLRKKSGRDLCHTAKNLGTRPEADECRIPDNASRLDCLPPGSFDNKLRLSSLY